jgi:GTP cyclohydrolase II
VALSPQEIDQILEAESHHDCPGLGTKKICVRIVAIAELPSRFGSFQIAAFWNNRDQKEHVAIMHGNVFGRDEVLTRIHSECLTGDGLGSLRCDCRDQLEAGMRRVAKEDCGLVLYLRQEGRGIGLINKIRAYELQDRGLDTVDANLALGFRDDEREYSIAAHMLHSLKVRSVKLLTNNPRKVNDLKALGIKVTARLPHVLPPNDYNRFYLETKASRSGHFIDFAGKAHLVEQSDQVAVDGMGNGA